MADWRGEGSGNKPEKKRTKEFPVIPRPEKNAEPKKDWRGRRGRTSEVIANDGQQRQRWIGGSDPATLSVFPWVKYLSLLALGGLALFASALFVYFIVYRAIPVPVYASISSNDTLDLGEIPFSNEFWNRLTGDPKNQGNIKLANFDDGQREHLLTRIAADDWREPIATGGRSKNITAFYFNGWIVRNRYDIASVDAPNDEWMLLPKDATPFGKDSAEKDSVKAISIKTFLERIASKIAPKGIAVIGLDLHVPNVLANLGDLEFPVEAIRNAYEGLKSEEKDKLVVVLPCDDGQENNVAPGLQGTAFGHYYLDGLRTGFEDPKASLGTFTKTLKARVEAWAIERRSSVQSPSILHGTNTDLSRFRFFGWADAPRKERTPDPVAKEILVDHFKGLDSCWEEHEELQKHRFQHLDPMLFAKIESNLLQLEILAESTPVSWKLRIEDLENDLRDAKSKIRSRRRGVSLIEDHHWAPKEVETTEAWKQWRGFSESFYESGKANVLFNEKTIGELGFALNDTPWLELQLCKILCQEVDWTRSESKERASQCIQKTLQNFERLQTLNCTYPSEVVWHLKKKLLRIDEQFLSSVDQLVLNNFADCSKLAKACRDAIVELENEANLLRDTTEYRDEVFHQTPYAMGFLMRWFRFNTDDQWKPIERANEWAKMVSVAFKYQNALSTEGGWTPSKEEIESQKRALKDQLGKLKEIALSSSRKTQGDDGDPVVIRDSRNAVRSPFLGLEPRRTYHQNLAAYFSRDWKSSKSATEQPKETFRPKVLADNFLRTLEQELEKGYERSTFESDAKKMIARFRAMLTSDLRSTEVFDATNAPVAIPTASDESQSFDSLYSSALRNEWIAVAIGQRANAEKIDLQWNPWSDSTHLRRFWDKEFRQLQRKRLMLAGWGNDPLEPASPNRSVPNRYYEVLAEKYCEKEKKEILPTEDSDKRRESLKIALLPSRTEAVPDSQSQKKTFRLADYRGWDGDAVASIHDGIGAPRTAASPSQNSIALNLKDPSTPVNVSEPIAKLPKLCVSLRGHRIWIDNLPESIPGVYEVRYTKESGPPKITVSPEQEERNVVIILDCSGSMNDGEPQKFAQAQDTVRKFLDILKQGESVERPCFVSLIAMGVSIDKKKGIQQKRDKGWTASKLEERPLEEKLYYFEEVAGQPKTMGEAEERVCVLNTQFLPADSSKLDDAISTVKAGGSTPLYASILVSYELLKDRNGVKEIIVVSDGENDVRDVVDTKKRYTYKGPMINLDDLASRVKNRPEVDLYVYQVGHDSNNKGETANFFKTIATSNDFKRPYADFKEIQQELEKKFSLPNFEVDYLDKVVGSPDQRLTGIFSKPLDLPRPGKVRVSVLGATSDEIEIQSNEKLTLRYQPKDSQRKLSFFSAKRMGKEEERDESYILMENKDASGLGTSRLDRNFFVKLETVLGEKLSLSSKIQWAIEPDPSPVFLQRPRWMMGRLKSDGARRSIPITEFQWESTHFPTFQSPDLPFKGKNSTWISRKFQFDLWSSDQTLQELVQGTLKSCSFSKFIEDLKLLERIPITDERDPTTKEKTIGWVTRKEDRIIVELSMEPNEDHPWFVIIPGTEEAHHTYPAIEDKTPQSTMLSVHEFKLGQTKEYSMEKPTIYFIETRGLEKLKDGNTIRHHQRILELPK